MSRRPDWHQKMFDAFAQARARQFQWGLHDCCLFVASVVDAMTDSDYAQRIAADLPYSTEAEARDYIARAGGLQPLVASYLGDTIPWGWAQQGDVVLAHDANGQEVLGVCEGAQVICATGAGIGPLPINRAICAWRIE